MNDYRVTPEPQFDDIAEEAVESESGQGLVEYSLILVLVALACVLSLGAFGTALAGAYDGIVAAWPS